MPLVPALLTHKTEVDSARHRLETLLTEVSQHVGDPGHPASSELRADLEQICNHLGEAVLGMDRCIESSAAEHDKLELDPDVERLRAGLEATRAEGRVLVTLAPRFWQPSPKMATFLRDNFQQWYVGPGVFQPHWAEDMDEIDLARPVFEGREEPDLEAGAWGCEIECAYAVEMLALDEAGDVELDCIPGGVNAGDFTRFEGENPEKVVFRPLLLVSDENEWAIPAIDVDTDGVYVEDMGGSFVQGTTAIVDQERLVYLWAKPVPGGP